MNSIHSTAIINPASTLGNSVMIMPYVVIGPDCSIGPNAVIFYGVHIDHTN